MRNLTKKCCLLLLIAVLAVCMLPLSGKTTAEAKKKVSVSKVTLTKPQKKSLNLLVGERYQLKVKIKPSNASNKAVTYKSSNSKVVAVSKTGKLTAKKKGTAKITITAKDGSKKKAVLTVNVKIPVSKIKVKAPAVPDMVLAKGSTYSIKTEVTPSNAFIKKLTYSSSNTKVLTVNSKGKVTAKKNGTATVKVKAADGSGKKATIKFTVGNPVTKVSISEAKVTKEPGTTYQVKAQVSPANASIKKLSYQSSNTTVATVDSKGSVKLKKEGTVKITAAATDGSGKYAVCTITVKKKEVTPSPKPEDENGYSLVWQDEFNGNTLNTKDWNYELHDPGWVNNELQQYTDSKENTYVKDGKLVIKAVKKEDANGTSYTSGRINTQGKHDFKYGRFETRAKVTSGTGFLPAIWVMPTNENLYGQWPKCGEIDIMEVLGNSTDTVYGTLHFGEPHTQKQGSYTLSNAAFSDDYHVYACEWEPDEIRFYVDGILYYTANDWFSKKAGFGEVTYPAPFDQDFYLIMNLAVGGDWPGNPDQTNKFEENAELKVDYVRVYQRKNYNENVKKPVQNVVLRDPDATGNYIHNSNFSVNEDLSDQQDWGFLLAGDGDATAKIINQGVQIDTNNAGNLDYSVQLVQPNLPIERGYRYRLSFDASAAEPRTMIADVSAPDNGYIRYLQDTKVALTTKKQSYSYEFDMKDASDANGRVEFNLGNQNSTAQVTISNVRLEKVGTVEISEDTKTILPDGNYVYNGEFQEGENRLAYWNTNVTCKGASISVTNQNNIRELQASVPKTVTALDQVIAEQDSIALTGNKKYVLSFDAHADSKKTIQTVVAGKTFESVVDKETKTYQYELTTDEGLSGTTIQFLLGVAGTTYIDNVRIREDGMIINGQFNNGFAGYEVFTDSSLSGLVSYGVDGLKEDNAACFTIQDTGDADWKIQLKQNNITLENGKWYKISFDAKSTLDRNIMYALQRDGSADNDWIPYSGTQHIALTKDYQTFTTTFQMTSKTDVAAMLSISMGSVDDTRITTEHTVSIDNITLEETASGR